MNREQMELSVAFARKIVGLGLKAQQENIVEGPVVTEYFFSLDHSMPIGRILNKAEDFALAAKAPKVLIERRGGHVVISVPNAERKFIDFKECLHWLATNPLPQDMNIPIPLGVNSVGEKACFDLTQMPHLLLAGETGSGKSVFESAILCSLGVVKSPKELEIYLVDTKGVDLPLFEQLPHVKQVVRTVREFNTLAAFMLATIRSRMDALRLATVRNIGEYNKLVGPSNAWPYILLMIDEFGDMVKQDEDLRKADKSKDKEDREFNETPTVKNFLLQIVQISRAAGVHVIAGTQRTSVKIVDGDIKANFPCRIALRLPTDFDSRTILGVGGAESLLGKGDMLVQRPEREDAQRYHGPFVRLEDISQIVLEHENIRSTFKQMVGVV